MKVGDVVALKSGGPAMTVTYINQNGKADCVWFVEGKPAQYTFPPDALKAKSE